MCAARYLPQTNLCVKRAVFQQSMRHPAFTSVPLCERVDLCHSLKMLEWVGIAYLALTPVAILIIVLSMK